jgi:hypothetical protein
MRIASRIGSMIFFWCRLYHWCTLFHRLLVSRTLLCSSETEMEIVACVARYSVAFHSVFAGWVYIYICIYR